MTTQTATVYEHPVNERLRTFLRLEFLFRQIHHCLGATNRWTDRIALQSLSEILEIAGRTDLKKELIQAMERHLKFLAQMEGNADVDHDELHKVLDELDGLIDSFYQNTAPIGQPLLSIKLLDDIKRRKMVAGGLSGTDLPELRFWLGRPREERTEKLNEWLNTLKVCEKAISLLLKLTRNSADPREVTAANGFYHAAAQTSGATSLIRVTLLPNAQCFPQISGNAHRITIRMLSRPDESLRIVQVEEDVPFTLTMCD